MEIDNHHCISDLSEIYADEMCDGDPGHTFSRASIAAAYIIGAEKTLKRVCNVIRESARVGGISLWQCERLLLSIESVERMPRR